MALNIAALTNPFVDELSFGLAKKVVLGLDILPYIRVETAVNGSLQLNTVDSTIYFTNSTCSTTDTGSTTFAGNVLSTCFIAVNNDICLQDLNKVWYGKYMSKTEMGLTDLGDFHDFILAEKAEKVGEQLNLMIWQGSTSAGASTYQGTTVTGNKTLCNGFLQAAYLLSATTVNLTKSAFTASNVIGLVDYIYSQAPAAIKSIDNIRLFVSPADFDIYLTAVRNANWFHGPADFAGLKEISHFGARNLKVTVANGLNGAASGTFILTYGENCVFGCLAESDFMKFDSIYNPFAKKLQINPAFNVGVQFVFGEHVVRSA